MQYEQVLILKKKGILSVGTVMSGLKSDFTNTIY